MLFGEIGLASQADLVQYTPAVTVSAGNWNLLVIIFFHYGHELFSNYLANLYLNQLHRFSKQMTINFKMKVIVCVKKKIKWVLWAPFFIISPQPVGVFKPEYLVFLWFFLHWLPPPPAPAFWHSQIPGMLFGSLSCWIQQWNTISVVCTLLIGVWLASYSFNR